MIAKWALELMGQNIAYTPRSAIKSQVLADFVTEWTKIQTPPAPIEHEIWIYFLAGNGSGKVERENEFDIMGYHKRNITIGNMSTTQNGNIDTCNHYYQLA
jgi:hypothetical protein